MGEGCTRGRPSCPSGKKAWATQACSQSRPQGPPAGNPLPSDPPGGFLWVAPGTLQKRTKGMCSDPGNDPGAWAARQRFLTFKEMGAKSLPRKGREENEERSNHPVLGLLTEVMVHQIVSKIWCVHSFWGQESIVYIRSERVQGPPKG